MSFLSLSTDSVSQAYPDQLLAVATEATVGDVIQLMRAERSSCALVTRDGKLAGIFTERDALRWMAEGGSSQQSVGERMAADPVTLLSSDSVGHAIEVMSEGGYRHLPIVDGEGIPCGVSAVRGIVHYLVDHFPETIYTLPPEPGRAPRTREGA